VPVATGSSTSALDSQSETVLEGSPRRSTSRITQGPLEAGAPFGARYRILRSLGAGGMGVVYQAWDDELGVAVALKVIRPEVTADPHVAREVERRFKRELLLARQVTHKNVVRIHDLGEVDGIKYITMPYVEGRDLAGVLHETGALPVPRALRIAKQVAAGLQAAHEAGVIHRDLKPENIMIDAEDQALIMDFGISRTTRNTSATMTQHGAIVGTLEYMAPEQGRGATIDHRADIYAFGLMLHDMLAGRRRLDAADGPVAEMMSRMQKAPPPLRTLVPSIPEPVERVVSTCVQPDADQRYATTAKLVADLERLDNSGHVVVTKTPRFGTKTVIAVAALVAAVAIGIAAWVLRPAPPPPAAREPLAVLIADFDNQAQEPLFEGALEQALGIAMEGAPFITSYSRTSAQAMLARTNEKTLNDRAARLIGLREGVKVVLAGAVSRSGNGYVLALRAIDVADGQEIATAKASAGSKTDVLGAVAKLATDMREKLGDAEADAGAETLTASTLEAVKNYSIAQDAAARGRFDDAIRHYDAAIKDDPQFGRAYSGLATSHFYMGRREEAQRNWDEALKYMDRMTEREKYRTRGTYFLAVTQNHEKAIEEYANLVRLYPADRVGHNNLAFAYFATLNFAKAREAGARAVALAPSNVTIRNNSALYAMYAGDFDTAAREAEEVIKLDASFWKSYLPIAMAALISGDQDAARDAYARMAKTDAVGASVAPRGMADLHMYYGRWSDAEELLRAGIGADRKADNQASLGAKLVALAESRFHRGDTAGALASLNEATKAGRTEAVLISAAALRVRAGDIAGARGTAAELGKEIQPQLRSYARIIEGDLAAADKRLQPALEAYTEALRGTDLWLGRFRRATAWLAYGRHAEADSDLDACYSRRGEAVAMFLDDLPTFRYLAELPYWKGRAQEGAGQRAAAAASYQQFLQLRTSAARDPLARDAETRLASLR
jgi:tetratricopeptide (TPR) repeat protein/tRNA A-37 threonylcarbamoyl transferase component Bud32